MKKILLVTYVMCWLICVLSVASIKDASISFYLVLMVPLLSSIYFFSNDLKEEHIIYGNKKCILWCSVISVVFASLFIGQELFLSSERMTISYVRIAFLILLSFVLLPSSPFMFIIFDKVGMKISEKGACSSLKIGFVCAVIMFFIQLLFSLSFYPCTMTGDSVTHWYQAVNDEIMSDYNPLIFNMLLKFLFHINGGKSPYPYVVFLNVLFSFVFGDVITYLRRLGIKIKYLIIGTIVVAILPPTYMLLTYLSKNPLIAIINLSLTLNLLKILTLPNLYCKKITWYIGTVISMASLYILKENHVVIVFPLAFLLLYFFKKNNFLFRRFLVTIVCSVIIILVIKGPLYNSLTYVHEEKKHETIRPLMAPIASALQLGLDIPDEVLALAEKVLPIDEWVSRYDSSNSDPLTWGEPRPQYVAISLGEAFRSYFVMLKEYPDVVLKDRLDGMNIIWNIDINGEKYNYRCPMGLDERVTFEDLEDYGIFGDSFYTFIGRLRIFLTELVELTGRIGIVNTLCWRSGIYIVLLLMEILYLKIKRRTSLVWSIAPTVSILITDMLVIAWQMYFYLWFFPMSVILLLIVGCVYNEDLRGKDVCVN